MSKHYTKKTPRYQIRFADRCRASAHGGQLAIHALLTQSGLWAKVKRLPALDPRQDRSKGYEPIVFVVQVLFCFCSGGVNLADAERLDEDEALKVLLGIEKFPDQSTLGEWLRALGAAGWTALRQLNRDLVGWALQQAKPSRYQHLGQLECFFDDTQIEVFGRTFEGAKLNYEGNLALSWQTLFVGPFLADSVLGATSETKDSPRSEEAGRDVSGCLPALLEANATLWAERSSYLYTDSASSAGKYLAVIAETFDAWSVSYNKWTGPLEAKAAEWPETSWSPVQKTLWRDGTEHTAQYAWMRYQPGGCEQPQLFATVRHKGPEDLFWRYAFVTCQTQATLPQAVFERHRLKGDKERLFSELLRDLDLHHPPCQQLNANRIFYTLATLAYNLLQALKLIHLPESEQPKRVRTLIHHLLLMPVELRRHARRVVASLYVPAGWVNWWRGLLAQLLPQCRQLGMVQALTG